MERRFYFDPYADGAAVFLGPTEAKLMELAWEKKEVTVKSALFHLGEKDSRAYTTVMTVLGRLVKKGLLEKRKDGRFYTYSPRQDKASFLAERFEVVARCLERNASFRNPATAGRRKVEEEA